jgi:nitronate monooxygenase
LRTPLCDLVGFEVPILLAGMGGVRRSDLTGAAPPAGGYPMLRMVPESPARIEAEVTALRAATDRRFAVIVIRSRTDPALLDRQIGPCLAGVYRPSPASWT